MKKIASFLGIVMLLNLITVPAVYAEEPDDPCAGFFPTDVENVNAQPLNAAVKLSWDPSEDDASVAGYDVYYGEQSIDEDDAEYPSSVDAGDALEYIVDGLENDIQYYFAVIAYDEEDPRNESVCWSIEASATPAEDAGEVNATDTEAPQVTDETEALNMEEVKVVFTEAVELPEEDPELAFAVEDDETFEALEVLDAVIDEDDETGATVIITTAAQTEDVVYKLTAGIDVSDRAGNPIISGTSDTAIFTGSAVVKEEVDEEAPVLLAVETIDSTHVGLTFSEAIIVDIDPATNFDITAEEDSSVVLDVLGVKLGPDSEGADDAYAIVTTSVQEERAYVITAKGLDDEAGNTIDSATNAVLFDGIPGVSAGDDDDDDNDVAGDDDDDDVEEVDLVAPNDVANFLANKVLEAQKYVVTLRWTLTEEGREDVVRQMLYMSTDQGLSFEELANFAPEIDEYDVKDLSFGEYWFKLTQKDEAGNESDGVITKVILSETGPEMIGLVALSLGFGRVFGRRRKK